jgi:O-antigen/teichoic acid export membrane protein
MSLKRNIFANYISQIYVVLIGIVMVPMYVGYMGVEAYGLVGFFAMLQAWFQLLDMGLTPTMVRETARFNGGATDALTLRRLLRAMEGVFLTVALIGATGMILSAGVIASSWLKVQHLPLHEVRQAITLMAVVVAMRWVCGLYRGAIVGFERIVWLSSFNIIVATARFVLVIPFFIYVGASPVQFFIYQLIIAILETIVLIIQVYSLLPKVSQTKKIPWQWAPLKSGLKFSLSIAFTSAVWVVITQTDKLILSKLLTLSEYAYFTLAIMVSSGVMFISGPITGALQPHMSKLAAEGDDINLLLVYHKATQMVGVIAIPVTLVLAFFAEQVLWVWTGDLEIARKAAPVLSLYALGNGILALGAFPYYLQFAKGDLKLHLIGNALFVVFLIPTAIWATIQHGAVGAGWAWLTANSIYFIIWVPIVHKRLSKGLHLKWLIKDVLPIIVFTTLASIIINNLMIWSTYRLKLGFQIGIVSLLVICTAATSSSLLRKIIILKYSKLYN